MSSIAGDIRGLHNLIGGDGESLLSNIYMSIKLIKSTQQAALMLLKLANVTTKSVL